MPRPTKGPRLGGSAQHERHLLANLATQLIVHESIKTTEARARRLRPERLRHGVRHRPVRERPEQAPVAVVGQAPVVQAEAAAFGAEPTPASFE